MGIAHIEPNQTKPKTKMKTIKVKMTDKETQAITHWTIRRFKDGWNCGGKLKRGRKISGWEFTDCGGVTRCIEGNWQDLVAAFRRTADNYGYACNIS